MTNDKAKQVLARWNDLQGRISATFEFYYPDSDSFYYISEGGMKSSQGGILLGVEKSAFMTRDEVLSIAGEDVAACSIFENQYVIDTCKSLHNKGVSISATVDPSNPPTLGGWPRTGLNVHSNMTIAEFDKLVIAANKELEKYRKTKEIEDLARSFEATVTGKIIAIGYGEATGVNA